MRIAIREQLALLVLFLVLFSLCIVAVPTWIYVDNFVRDVEKDGLSLTASLKASRITAELELIHTSCFTISSRILVQNAFQDYYRTGEANWIGAAVDVRSALSVGATTGLLQARLYSRNDTGASNGGLLNVTGPNVADIVLPYTAPDGSPVILGDSEYGYPPMLYPNITYVDLGHGNQVRPEVPATAAEAFPNVIISRDGGLLLGPLVLNETAALISISVPIRDNDDTFILGYMTVVSMASPMVQLRDSREGMGKSGMLLVVGPTTPWNRFTSSLTASNATYTPNRTEFGDLDVHFVLPPQQPNPEKTRRHSTRDYGSGSYNQPFQVAKYPAIWNAFTQKDPSVNNASSVLNTHNEQNAHVAVGYARTQTPLVNWTVIVEKTVTEAYEPIDTLKAILLGTVFGTTGLILLVILPIAHISVLPIRRLKAATAKTTHPPGYDDSSMGSDTEEDTSGSGSGAPSQRSKNGIFTTVARLMKRRPKKQPRDHDASRRLFKIPGKVEDRRHLITDELTELSKTFNAMSDELVRQYESLDLKVAERTRELEESKKSAEAANESKTLFIANISHELKTPLNGIMGMCSVSMEETDVDKIRSSLITVWNSGDLLLHLLDDILSFSKNQIGHQLSLNMGYFAMSDIRAQILSIFDQQVQDKRIKFAFDYVSTSLLLPDVGSGAGEKADARLQATGPPGTGRLKQMCLWGDKHRILQILINLVSNSLKFTPPEGKVVVRVNCIAEDESARNDNASRTSSFSKLSKGSRRGRGRQRGTSGSLSSAMPASRTPGAKFQGGTALAINPMEPTSSPHILARERSPSPPPAGSKTYTFHFEVQDTGLGIPEDMQEKVFEPFVQVEPGLSKKYGGTGLGLSISQQLARLMNGVITLESTPNVGTTFTLRIPLRYVKDGAPNTTSANDGDATRTASDVADQRSSPTGNGQPVTPQRLSAANPLKIKPGLSDVTTVLEPHNNRFSHLCVLVADDNSTNIEVACRMLKLERISNLTVVRDGQQAFDAVMAKKRENQFFDLIFMDVAMPHLDGIACTHLIREMGIKSAIVAVTACSADRERCLASGMDEFVTKPIQRPILREVLTRFATIPEKPEAVVVEEVEAAGSSSEEQSSSRIKGADVAPAATGNDASEAPLSSKPALRSGLNGTAKPADLGTAGTGALNNGHAA